MNVYRSNEAGELVLVLKDVEGNEVEFRMDDIDYCAIDEEFYGSPHDYEWRLINGNRAVCKGEDDKLIYLYRHLMKADRAERAVDHKDGDPLNNTRSNLRFSTQQENMHNKAINKKHSIGLKGVSIVIDNREAVYVRGSAGLNWKVESKQFSVKRIGIMEATKQAAIFAQQRRIELHGDFARN